MNAFPEQHQTAGEEIGKEIGRIRDTLAEAKDCKLLTPYEQQWCFGLNVRILESAEATRMTEKQWNVFRRIEAKIESMEI